MRLSEWRKRAPSKDSVSPKVQAVVDPALGMLGAPGDPDCWVVWGDDPGVRYMILAPTQSGLVQLNVRVNVAGRRAARQRQGRSLEPGPARGARARDAGRPSPDQLPGRDPGPQRGRRHGRRDRRVRPGALRRGRRPSCAGDVGRHRDAPPSDPGARRPARAPGSGAGATRRPRRPRPRLRRERRDGTAPAAGTAPEGARPAAKPTAAASTSRRSASKGT